MALYPVVLRGMFMRCALLVSASNSRNVRHFLLAYPCCVWMQSDCRQDMNCVRAGIARMCRTVYVASVGAGKVNPDWQSHGRATSAGFTPAPHDEAWAAHEKALSGSDTSRARVGLYIGISEALAGTIPA